MKRNPIKDALNNTLSRLPATAPDAGQLLARAQGGEKVKRKISVALVFALMIVTLAVTALAIMTIRELGHQVAQNEKEQGSFVHWTLEQKVKLIANLVELNYMETNDAFTQLMSNRLNEPDAHVLANTLAADYIGSDIEGANFLTIMQVPMGPVAQWNYEQKAWYSGLMQEVGLEGDGMTRFVEPTGRIGEQEAIAIARREVAAGYGMEESRLDTYIVSVSFEVPEDAEPGDSQAYWRIAFTAPPGMREEERMFIQFPVYVHPVNGSLLWSVQEMRSIPDYHTRPDNEIYTAYGALEAQADGAHFRDWPLHLKATFSQQVAPKVREVVASGDLSPITLFGTLDVELMAQSSHVYGLPDSTNMTQEAAMARAAAALQEAQGLTEDPLQLYRKIPVYYDVTNMEKPLWRFIFSGGALHQNRLDSTAVQALVGLCFRVEVDALSGKMADLEEFPFALEMQELSYRVKWY